MRVTVIGGTGHIGSFLVPRLVRAGARVTVVSRGERRPYGLDRPGHADAWAETERVTVDRVAAEADGRFGRLIADQRPDAVVDLTCFTVAQAAQLVGALDGQRLVHTGSVWAYGASLVVPTTESSPKAPWGDYGVAKAALEDYLLRSQPRVPATVIHPGHISAAGWPAINPAGNLDLEVYQRLIREGSILLPDLGLQTLQHVHADDVAALHQVALGSDAAVGEAYNSVCTESLTLRGYADLVARDFGHPLELTLLPWAEWAQRAGAEHAAVTADHVERSPHHSMAKAERDLGFVPDHSAADTVLEAARWLAGSELLRPAREQPGR